MTDDNKIEVRNLSFSYGKHLVLDKVNADFRKHAITAITGPSGTGKSSLLLALNRLSENIPTTQVSGEIWLKCHGQEKEIHARDCNLPDLRRCVAMVFQAPNPLPMSIYKNVAFPLKLAGQTNKAAVEPKVQHALEEAFLWDEVKDRLHTDARDMSGGQQQRLCIARSLVLEPDVLMLDEPTSSLDREASHVIEELLLRLKSHCTVIVVSHYLDQVGRIADQVLELKDKRLSVKA